jgi:hypothetical protein
MTMKRREFITLITLLGGAAAPPGKLGQARSAW